MESFFEKIQKKGSIPYFYYINRGKKLGGVEKEIQQGWYISENYTPEVKPLTSLYKIDGLSKQKLE